MYSHIEINFYSVKRKKKVANVDIEACDSHMVFYDLCRYPNVGINSFCRQLSGFLLSSLCLSILSRSLARSISIELSLFLYFFFFSHPDTRKVHYLGTDDE